MVPVVTDLDRNKPLLEKMMKSLLRAFWYSQSLQMIKAKVALGGEQVHKRDSTSGSGDN